MLSPLPAAPDRSPESGVAPYTASLIRAMPTGVDLTVLAQRDVAQQQLGVAAVVPAWTPNLLLPIQVKTALARVKPDVLHMQHEFNLYGGLIQGALLTLMMIALRRRGLTTVATVHGVVAPDDVTTEFLARNGLPRSRRMVRVAFASAYRAIDACTDLLIVHHEHFRGVLEIAYGVQGEKVVVIPPGAPERDNSIHRIQKIPGKHILALGFLTGYKIPEILVETAESDAIPGATFTFCVGANPRITDRGYRSRYAALERRVRALGSRAKWNGYIPDESLEDMLNSADVLVLPYTECVSVSAVAALARRSQTRICYSRPLRPLFGSGPLEFELNSVALGEAIARALTMEADSSFSGFTSWTEAAQATQAAWIRALTLR